MVYKLRKIKNFVLSESQPANIYIRRRYTNIFLTLTDFNHKVIVCKSAGSAGMVGNKKKKTTPQAIEALVLSLDYYFKRYYIKNVKIFLRSKITVHMFTLIRYLSFLGVNIIGFKPIFAVSHTTIRKRTPRRK